MTEEPQETLEFISDPNGTNDSIGQLVVLLADQTDRHGRRSSALKTPVCLIDDVIDLPFHQALLRTTASVPPLRTPKSGSNDSAPGVERRRGQCCCPGVTDKRGECCGSGLPITRQNFQFLTAGMLS